MEIIFLEIILSFFRLNETVPSPTSSRSHTGHVARISMDEDSDGTPHDSGIEKKDSMNKLNERFGFRATKRIRKSS